MIRQQIVLEFYTSQTDKDGVYVFQHGSGELPTFLREEDLLNVQIGNAILKIRLQTKEKNMTKEIDNDELYLELLKPENCGIRIDHYQKLANRFINLPQYKDDMDYFLNSALGLLGEGGEFAEIVKKVRFHGHPLTEELKLKMKKELGDVLWYIAQACIPLETTMSEVATLNLVKLRDRHGSSKFSEEASRNKDESKEAQRITNTLEMKPEANNERIRNEERAKKYSVEEIQKLQGKDKLVQCEKHGQDGTWIYRENSVKWCRYCSQPVLEPITKQEEKHSFVTNQFSDGVCLSCGLPERSSIHQYSDSDNDEKSERLLNRQSAEISNDETKDLIQKEQALKIAKQFSEGLWKQKTEGVLGKNDAVWVPRVMRFEYAERIYALNHEASRYIFAIEPYS